MTKTFWTLSHGAEGTFTNLDAVRTLFATIPASQLPPSRESSVWATEHRLDARGCAETVRTVTLRR